MTLLRHRRGGVLCWTRFMLRMLLPVCLLTCTGASQDAYLGPAPFAPPITRVDISIPKALKTESSLLQASGWMNMQQRELVRQNYKSVYLSLKGLDPVWTGSANGC